jgi:DNA-directed RNA polymerase subunit K/omega
MSSNDIPLDFDEISDAEEENIVNSDAEEENVVNSDAEDNDEPAIYEEDDDDDIEDPDLDDPTIPGEIQSQENQTLVNPLNLVDDYLNDSDDDEYGDNYLQKFDANVTQNYVNANHPEVFSHNFDEVTKMMQIHRDKQGNIIDPCHKTLPIMTKFEKTRIIGQRAKQIETGSIPFIKVPDNIIDSYLIAELELQQRKLPFIIRRPLPNGTCEYWDANDLEMIHY